MDFMKMSENIPLTLCWNIGSDLGRHFQIWTKDGTVSLGRQPGHYQERHHLDLHA